MFRVSQLPALFRCIRWVDVLVLEGVPILGVAFSLGRISDVPPARLALFCAGSFSLLAHVFTLNDWADFTGGVHHSNRAMLQLEGRNVSPRKLLIFSLVLLIAGLGIFLFLSGRCFLLALAVSVLGIFYSHPLLNAKSIPIVSTLVHLVGGTVHFLLGYGLFCPIDQRGVLIGLFFGLTFAAGHPLQEVRDLLVDRQVGAKTNAVVFGKLPSFFVSLILFACEYAYLFWLGWSGLVPRPLAGLALVAFPIHLGLALFGLRGGLDSDNVTQFEKRYRILYAIIGLVMLGLLCR